MRWYWVISCSNTVPKAFVSSAEDLKGHEDWQLDIGQYVKNWDPTAWIQCTDPEWDGEPDDALQTHLAIPIYSPRLQEVIGNARFSGIQFLPLRVLHMNGSEIPGFAIANILNIPTAMDMEKSLYGRYEEDYFCPEDRGRVSGVYRIALKQTSLKGFDIIRVKEFCRSLYVSERFKLEFEAARCTGYSFQEVQLT
jgi:hypothetical protein